MPVAIPFLQLFDNMIYDFYLILLFIEIVSSGKAEEDVSPVEIGSCHAP